MAGVPRTRAGRANFHASSGARRRRPAWNTCPTVFATYFGTRVPLFVPAGLLLAGVWSATQARKTLLPLLLLAGLSPVLVSLKGVSHFPWAYARFQIYCVPLLLILMAEGIRWLAAAAAAQNGAAPAAWTADGRGGRWPGFRRWPNSSRSSTKTPPTRGRPPGSGATPPGDLIVIKARRICRSPPSCRKARTTREGGRIRQKTGRTGGRAGACFSSRRTTRRFGPPGAPRAVRQIAGGGLRGTGTAVCAACARTSRAWRRAHRPRPGRRLSASRPAGQREEGAPGRRAARMELLARLCRTQTERFRSLPEQMRARWSGPDSESTAETSICLRRSVPPRASNA